VSSIEGTTLYQPEKTNMSNYPDDIRNYDDDPRSPFFDPPTCVHCGEELDSIDCFCRWEEETLEHNT